MLSLLKLTTHTNNEKIQVPHNSCDIKEQIIRTKKIDVLSPNINVPSIPFYVKLKKKKKSFQKLKKEYLVIKEKYLLKNIVTIFLL